MLHLWSDGFSIDDGDLIRFDDPDHLSDLQMIRQGRAPLHLMNVRYDQPVDVKLQQHNEDYRPLPKVYKPFGGEGRRLGSPVPGDRGASVASAAAAATTTTGQSAASAAAAGQPPTTGVDESQPVLVLRIQLPDGTRLLLGLTPHKPSVTSISLSPCRPPPSTPAALGSWPQPSRTRSTGTRA